MEAKKQKKIHEHEESDFTVEALLDESVLENVPSIQVFVARIIDKKKISELIVGLNRVHPIESLQHLKRINKDRILMCLKDNKSENDVKKFFEDLKYNLSPLGEFEICDVPGIPPKTRKQFDLCNKQWPCNFHKNNYLEKLVSGNCFSEEERRNNNKWMQLALETGQRGNGCGAVVSLGNESIGVACDSSSKHPLQHAPMVAIDLVARSQGGGVWPLSPLDHHSHNPPSSDPAGPYLCTGYDIFLALEPCLMCAMALVHSRIRRIFFCNKNPSRGALASVAKIQSLKALNHHYEVFRMKHVLKV